MDMAVFLVGANFGVFFLAMERIREITHMTVCRVCVCMVHALHEVVSQFRRNKAGRDSYLQSPAYQAGALTTELPRQLSTCSKQSVHKAKQLSVI